MIIDPCCLLPGPTAKGDMAPQHHWFKGLGLLSSMCHSKAGLDEGGVVLQIRMSFKGSCAMGTKQSEVASTVGSLSARGSEVERGSTKSE